MRAYVANRYAKSLLEEGMSEKFEEGAKSLLESAGVSPETAGKVAPIAAIIPEFIPGIGEAVGANNTQRALERGDYGEAALEGLFTGIGAVPVLGDIAKYAIFAGLGARGANRKGADAAKKVFDEQNANPALDLSNPHQVADSVGRQMRESAEAGSATQPWFVGADHKPRFEISDNKATIDGNLKKSHLVGMQDKLNEMGGGQYKYPLSTIMKHDALYAQYPQLRDVPVSIMRGEDVGGMASYRGRQDVEGLEDGLISLNVDSLISEGRGEMINSLLHETQHAVQELEGFARGTGGSDFKSDHIQSLRNGSGKTGKLADEQVEFFDEMAKGVHSGDISEADADRFNYLLNAGEGEARAVEMRRKLTGRDRRALSPDGDYNIAGPLRHLLPDADEKDLVHSMYDFISLKRD